MFDPTLTSRTYPQAGPYALPPVLPREALAGVRTRRILALCVDLIIVGFLAFALWLLLLSRPSGSAFSSAAALPFVAFFYNGFSVSGRHRGTIGMRMMDIEMQLVGGGRVPFIIAAIHAVLFYFSWMFPPDPACLAVHARQALSARYFLGRDRASGVLTEQPSCARYAAC